VPLDQVRRYGVVAGDPAGERIVRVRQMVEKPEPQSAPSRMGVAGRYILTPAVFEHIRTNARGAGGEIQLTDGIAKLMDTEGVHAYQYLGKRYDCGSKEGFLEATVELALKHPEVGPGFRAYLERLSLRA
jgi:UTP--glucose-1-phosphate uridylyltransferase